MHPMHAEIEAIRARAHDGEPNLTETERSYKTDVVRLLEIIGTYFVDQAPIMTLGSILGNPPLTEDAVRRILDDLAQKPGQFVIPPQPIYLSYGLINPTILALFRKFPQEWQDGHKEYAANHLPSRTRLPEHQPLMDEIIEASAALIWWGHYGAPTNIEDIHIDTDGIVHVDLTRVSAAELVASFGTSVIQESWALPGDEIKGL